MAMKLGHDWAVAVPFFSFQNGQRLCPTPMAMIVNLQKTRPGPGRWGGITSVACLDRIDVRFSEEGPRCMSHSSVCGEGPHSNLLDAALSRLQARQSTIVAGRRVLTSSVGVWQWPFPASSSLCASFSVRHHASTRDEPRRTKGTAGWS